MLFYSFNPQSRTRVFEFLQSQNKCSLSLVVLESWHIRKESFLQLYYCFSIMQKKGYLTTTLHLNIWRKKKYSKLFELISPKFNVSLYSPFCFIWITHSLLGECQQSASNTKITAWVHTVLRGNNYYSFYYHGFCVCFWSCGDCFVIEFKVISDTADALYFLFL